MSSQMREGKIKLAELFQRKESETGPYIIAEIGVNYYEVAHKNGVSLLEAATLMIDEAARAGAHAVKFQAYKADTLAVKDAVAYWDTGKERVPSQYELFKKYDKLSYNNYAFLAEECKKRGIEFLCTPFDTDAVHALAPLVPAFKVASADITNKPHIRLVARQRKPVLLSTGAARLSEIARTVEWLREEGCEHIGLLHCVLSYPTRYEDANLGVIAHLARTFPGCIVGYSDHCPPDHRMLVLTLAFLQGARIIEKHFTLDKKLPGNDHYHAMDPADLRTFVANVEMVRVLHGSGTKDVLPCEQPARAYARRSLVAVREIPSGQVITEEMLGIKRPGTGIPPEFIDLVCGRKARHDLAEGAVLRWEDLC